jgi:hypothetical protein
MRRLSRILFVCLVAGLAAYFASRALADNALRLDEARTRLKLASRQLETALAVDNPAGRALLVRVKLELLDTAGQVRAQAERDATLAAGANLVPLAFKWGDLAAAEQQHLLVSPALRNRAGGSQRHRLSFADRRRAL